MTAEKKKKDALEELLRSSAQQRQEVEPREDWADHVMQDIHQISLDQGQRSQHAVAVLVDYIDAMAMAFWRFVPASALVILLFGMIYFWYHPIDDTLAQVWNNQHDAFLWIELLGI
jgi:ABC-type transport system involved in cytochrome bd biosynthesis fused ATPase/permease subunit